MTTQTLQYGDQTIPYRVVFRPEPLRRLKIQVHPDGRVQVHAPEGTRLGEVKQAVARRASWLSANLARIRAHNLHVLPREYVSGEGHYYLGRRYQLKIRRSKIEVPTVKLWRGRFEIAIRPEEVDVRSLLWAWYRIHAHTVFEDRLQRVCDRLSWLGQKPAWRLLTMRRQWGSCSSKGVLILNPHLIKAPGACIDYVLLHELCHLKVHNHSRKFYALLRREMPQWHEVKDRLDTMAPLLLNS